MTLQINRRLPLGIALLLLVGGAFAQGGGLTRTIIDKGDVSITSREAVVARIELATGAHVGRHTHPGDEISYVSEGEVELSIDGQAPRLVKAGESFVIPAGIAHSAHNAGNAPAHLVGVYVVEKGKPLTSPAP
jgi:quercetin dioxygenase-like cupin family protein